MGSRRSTPLLAAVGLLSLACGLPAQPDPASEIMPLSAHSLLLDVTLAGDRVVAVGERGHILLSEDYGQTWRQVPSPTRSTLTAVMFISPETGWVAGHDNVVLHTRDGGLTWRFQNPPAGPDTHLLEVQFLDPQHGFAAGAYGIFFATDDGGASWESREVLEEEMHINRITRAPDGSLYLAVEAGGILVSGDDGATWEEMDSPYEGSLFGILPLAARTLLAYGLRGHVFRSNDAGGTWTAVETPVQVLLMDAVRLSSGQIILAGQSGQFLSSHDGGRSFELWRVPVQGAAALTECPDGSLLAVGLSGIHRLTPPKPRPLEPAP